MGRSWAEDLEQVVVCLVADPLRHVAGVLLNGPEAHRSRKLALVGPDHSSRRLPGLIRSIEMKKFSKKGVLLFAGAMAVCAFVLPAVASAATWGPAPSHHVLDSPNFGFTSAGGAGAITSSCTSSSFTANVAVAARQIWRSRPGRSVGSALRRAPVSGSALRLRLPLVSRGLLLRRRPAPSSCTASILTSGSRTGQALSALLPPTARRFVSLELLAAAVPGLATGRTRSTSITLRACFAWGPWQRRPDHYEGPHFRHSEHAGRELVS